MTNREYEKAIMADKIYTTMPSLLGKNETLVGPGIDEAEGIDANAVFVGTNDEQRDRILRLLDDAYKAGRESMRDDFRKYGGR